VFAGGQRLQHLADLAAELAERPFVDDHQVRARNGLADSPPQLAAVALVEAGVGEVVVFTLSLAQPSGPRPARTMDRQDHHLTAG
jgi:hypothetical protein